MPDLLEIPNNYFFLEYMITIRVYHDKSVVAILVARKSVYLKIGPAAASPDHDPGGGHFKIKLNVDKTLIKLISDQLKS